MTQPTSAAQKVEHIPGPWHVDPDLREGMEWNNHIVAGDDMLGTNVRICFMAHSGGKNRERDEANAYLIAAAPNLLTVLSEITDALASIAIRCLIPNGTNGCDGRRPRSSLNYGMRTFEKAFRLTT